MKAKLMKSIEELKERLNKLFRVLYYCVDCEAEHCVTATLGEVLQVIGNGLLNGDIIRVLIVDEVKAVEDDLDAAEATFEQTKCKQ